MEGERKVGGKRRRNNGGSHRLFEYGSGVAPLLQGQMAFELASFPRTSRGLMAEPQPAPASAGAEQRLQDNQQHQGRERGGGAAQGQEGRGEEDGDGGSEGRQPKRARLTRRTTPSGVMGQAASASAMETAASEAGASTCRGGNESITGRERPPGGTLMDRLQSALFRGPSGRFQGVSEDLLGRGELCECRGGKLEEAKERYAEEEGVPAGVAAGHGQPED